MTLDLDALDALRHKCVIPDFSSNSSQQVRDHANLYEATFHALPELLRLARIGQRVERNAKRPDPMSQALNEGDGVYRP